MLASIFPIEISKASHVSKYYSTQSETVDSDAHKQFLHENKANIKSKILYLIYICIAYVIISVLINTLLFEPVTFNSL